MTTTMKVDARVPDEVHESLQHLTPDEVHSLIHNAEMLIEFAEHIHGHAVQAKKVIELLLVSYVQNGNGGPAPKHAEALLVQVAKMSVDTVQFARFLEEMRQRFGGEDETESEEQVRPSPYR